MEPSGIARGQRGGSRATKLVLRLALVAAALALPGVALADPTGGDVGTASSEAASHADTGGPATTDGSGNGNGNANGHDDAPPAAAGAGTDGEAQQGAAVDQSASATASADQHGNGNANGHGDDGPGNGNGNGNAYGHGDGNGNAHAEIRVSDPGPGEGVNQANDADATASATASATVETGGDATVAQAAAAGASAVQDEVGNVHLSVRVDSPGDDGDVTQVNHVAAAATAGVMLEADVDGSLASTGSAQAAATAVQDQVTNTVVTVRVLSPGSDGTVTQANEALAAAVAEEATATAAQDDVRNTYVGIRVESPGGRGPIEQASTATADVSAGGSVALVTDGLDTIVFVDVSAPELTLPTSLARLTTVWEWIWIWSADEASFDGSPFVVDGDGWSWSWGDVPFGTVVEREARPDERPGTWSWDWSWAREVDGWGWGWWQSRALDCAACVWVWDWDWDWHGQPAAPTDEAGAGTTTPVSRDGQSTSVSAAATAVAEAVVRQTLAGDDGEAARFAGQLAELVQVIDASAVAVQPLDGPDGAFGPDSTERSLEVVADASGSAALDQSIVQVGGVEGAGALEQWAGQQAELGQGVGAAAVGRQDLGAATTGSGVVRADAAAVADHDQRVVQGGHVRDGLLSQWAGQLAQVVQLADAVAETIQVVRDTGSGSAHGRSVAADLAVGRQATVQEAARHDGIGSQTAAQSAQVGQMAAALSVTSQTVSSTGAAASSDATADNRSLVLQAGAQSMNGAAALDLQELVQETVVLQTALAASRSDGGIGGIARTSNCSTVQQGAGQGIGAPVSMEAVDLTAFCALPTEAQAPVRGRGRRGNALRRPDAAGYRTARVTGTACGSRRGACGGARLPERARRPAEPRRLDHSSFERAGARSGQWPRGAPLTRFRLRPSASAPRHAPGGLRGAEGRRQGVAAPSDG